MSIGANEASVQFAPVARTTVFRAGALGDFVVTLPALRELHAERGGLHLVGNATAARALAPELFARSESIDDPRWAGLFDDAIPLPEPEGEAVVLLRDPGAAARLRRRGWRIAAAGAPFSTEPHRHVAEHLLAVVGRADAARRWRTATTLATPLREGSARRLVVHPGSGSPRKNWPVERFAELLDHLGVPGPILCGPADAEAAERLSRLSGRPVAIPASLAELVDLLAGATLYVGNDSGVSHVAAALGTPTVTVFGPTRAARWAPWGPRVSTVEPPTRCALCREAEERAAACRCVETVEVDDVLRAAWSTCRGSE